MADRLSGIRPTGHPPYGETAVTADHRRWRVPGGTYLFTFNLLERRSDLLVRHVDSLRDAVRRTRRERPLHIGAWVVLPEPLRCIITLPEGNDDVSNRIKAIKIRFVRAIPATDRRSRTRVARGERSLRQRRFREHASAARPTTSGIWTTSTSIPIRHQVDDPTRPLGHARAPPAGQVMGRALVGLVLHADLSGDPPTVQRYPPSPRWRCSVSSLK